MARRVVCISRFVGAGGEAVGRIVAERLGYQLVDEEILQRAAEASGVSVEELADAERRTTFVDGLLRNLTVAGNAAAVMGAGGAAVADLGGGGSGGGSKSLRALIQQSIVETADRGNVVIVSHAASHALGGSSDVLRVLVTASPETRAERVANGAPMDSRKAAKLIADSDASRAAYLKRFYGIGDELPTHYDLALNSDSLSIAQMSELVVSAASAPSG